MATVDVTAEEIEGAPLLLNPPVKEVKPRTRSRLNLVLCIVLTVNTLFQLIAIVTPGWNVQRGDLASSFESVYYITVCADTTPLENVSTTECRTVTFLDDFAASYNSAKDTLKPALVAVYNLRVRFQMNIQFSWFIVAGTTIFQMIRYIRTTEAYPRITALNAIVLICACSAMYQALYEAIVRIDLIVRQAEYLPAEVGFPYSVFFYSIAFMQTCAITVIVLKQMYDYIRHVQLALMETKVQVDTLQAKYDAEVEEFRHYRRLQSDKNHLRGRSRKSHRVDRSSKRGDDRQRYSKQVREHADHSPNKHSARYMELLERSHGRSSRKRDHDRHTKSRNNHKRDLSPATSDLSATSRESSLDDRNRTRKHHAPSSEAIQLTSQPIQASPAADINIHDRMPESQADTSKLHKQSQSQTNSKTPSEELAGADLVKKSSNTRLGVPTEDRAEAIVPINREQINGKDMKNDSIIKDDHDNAGRGKLSEMHNATRTISVDVHIPSVDGKEISM